MSSAPVWLGVLGAVALAGSLAAVLTLCTNAMPGRWQEVVGGGLSVLAVGVVTATVLRTERTAATRSRRLRDNVTAARGFGAGALTLSAFLAVTPVGLVTTLFLWAAVRASGQAGAPLLGAGAGLAFAVLLCWLLFRRAIRPNLRVFFSRTAIALIVVAAGVLAYGLGALQDAGLLSGHSWIAFDGGGFHGSGLDSSGLNGGRSHGGGGGGAGAGSWWTSVLLGVTELSPRMTVLQAVAWAGYLLVVIPAFLRTGTAPSPTPASAAPLAGAGGWARLSGRRSWGVVAALVAVPLAATGTAIALLPTASTAAVGTVTVTATGCADGWRAGHSGTQTFTVTNDSGQTARVDLENAIGGVVAEIETLGPTTTASMTATLSPGTYTFRCSLTGTTVGASGPAQAAGTGGATGAGGAGGANSAPITAADLQPAVTAYQQYTASKLASLADQVSTIRTDLARGDLAVARTDWLAAQLTWEQVGAAYDSFGDLGDAIDGLPQGLPAGVNDPDFTGLHRLEYGLWHGQAAATLNPVAGRLANDIAALRTQLPELTVDPTDLPLRAHEILEDALRDHLSGMTDEGAGAAYPETYADVQGTRFVLDELAPLITARAPQLLPAASSQLDALQAALLGTRRNGAWQPPQATPQPARQRVDSTIGALLETLAVVPDLLEI